MAVTITTGQPYYVRGTSGYFKGELTDMNSIAAIDCYFEYRIKGAATWTNDTSAAAEELTAVGEFVSAQITLTEGETYEVRAVAEWVDGTTQNAYGSAVEFDAVWVREGSEEDLRIGEFSGHVAVVGEKLSLLRPVINSSVSNHAITNDVTGLSLSMDGSGAPRVIAAVDVSELTEICVKARVKSFNLETDEWCGFGAIFKDTAGDHHFAGIHNRGSTTLYAYNLGKTWDYTNSTDWESAYSSPGSQTAPMWIAVWLNSAGSVVIYDSTDGSSWTQRKSDTAFFTVADLEYFGLGLHTGWDIESDDRFEVVFDNVEYGNVWGLS